MLGFANTALEWGGARWSTVVWTMIPTDDAHARGRLLLRELFHRIQPQLGFQIRDGRNEHLDTLEGRYWLQLEWRALARALGCSGADRVAALRDALAFRATRHARFPGAAEEERLLEINEGLAQYTGTVASSQTRAEATADAIDQLDQAPRNPTFVRTFAYASGAGYGILLDGWSPGWTRRIKGSDDLAALLSSAAKLQPADDATAAAARYGGPGLRAEEEKRQAERAERIAALRRRFVDGPVLVLPRARSASFVTTGLTPIPGIGTAYPSYRATGEWGSLEAQSALVSAEGNALTLPGPVRAEGSTRSGEGWTVELVPGWVVRPGPREGDSRVVQAPRPVHRE
jgi:hypothetical protein